MCTLGLIQICGMQQITIAIHGNPLQYLSCHPNDNYLNIRIFLSHNTLRKNHYDGSKFDFNITEYATLYLIVKFDFKKSLRKGTNPFI